MMNLILTTAIIASLPAASFFLGRMHSRRVWEARYDRLWQRYGNLNDRAQDYLQVPSPENYTKLFKLVCPGKESSDDTAS